VVIHYHGQGKRSILVAIGLQSRRAIFFCRYIDFRKGGSYIKRSVFSGAAPIVYRLGQQVLNL
jgi:hypothetical protein